MKRNIFAFGLAAADLVIAGASFQLGRRSAPATAAADLAIGAEIGDEIEVLQGLAEGEQVASGQFLIDSEARLRSVTADLAAPAAASATPVVLAPVPQVGQAQPGGRP